MGAMKLLNRLRKYARNWRHKRYVRRLLSDSVAPKEFYATLVRQYYEQHQQTGCKCELCRAAKCLLARFAKEEGFTV
jgi:hypothetical protein